MSRTLSRLVVLASLLGWVGMASSATAGGLKDDEPMDAPFNWTGLYIGINGGYGWGRAPLNLDASVARRLRVFRAFGLPAQTLVSDTTTTDPTVSAGGTADVDGGFGGIHVGYNWQRQDWVFGLEADFQWTGQDGSIFVCSTAACGAGAVSATANFDLNWFGTVRARAGVLVDPRVLLYITGGFAYANIDADYTAGIVGGPSATFSKDGTISGWVIGAGGSWAIKDNWLLRAEYLYMDFGDIGRASGSASSQTITPNSPNQGFTSVLDTTVNAGINADFSEHVFRIGLSYKFGEDRAIEPLK